MVQRQKKLCEHTESKGSYTIPERKHFGSCASCGLRIKPAESHVLIVDDLEVRVIVKRRLRNINLRVQPDGRIEVSVLPHYSDRYVSDFVRQKYGWIRQMQKKYENSPMGIAASASASQLKEWRQVVEACTRALVEQWAPVLDVQPKKFAYRKMKSRWGSCQPATGRICINIVLALYPPECLEYVVVHELCHLLVAGHGSEFKALMSSVMPDWKERRALLN